MLYVQICRFRHLVANKCKGSNVSILLSQYCFYRLITYMFTPQSYLFKNIIPEVVSKYGNNNALGFVDEEFISYTQMGKRIDAVMAYMEALGIEPGDRVILYSQNMPNWGIVYFATQCMGVVVVPVLPDFNAYELGNIIEHSGAKAIFISSL